MSCERHEEIDVNPQIIKLERRCPRLGGPVRFGYCLTGDGNGPPCFKILDCWWERFDVHRYLEDHLPAGQFKDLLQAGPPAPKVTSLVELIEAARQRAGVERSQAED